MAIKIEILISPSPTELLEFNEFHGHGPKNILRETNIAPENYTPGQGDSYWKPSFFRGYVSFRECNLSQIVKSGKVVKSSSMDCLSLSRKDGNFQIVLQSFSKTNPR